MIPLRHKQYTSLMLATQRFAQNRKTFLYVENHSRAELLDRVLDEELPRYAEALERLGQ